MITEDQARALEKGTVYGVVTRYQDVDSKTRIISFRATFLGVGDYGELRSSMRPVYRARRPARVDCRHTRAVPLRDPPDTTTGDHKWPLSCLRIRKDRLGTGRA